MAYSYGSSVSLPCRGCGEGYRPDQPVCDFRDRRWHVACFKCQSCKAPFKAVSDAKPVGDLPYCAACFPKASQSLCATCSEPIDDSFITVPGLHGKKFHKGCFLCSTCKQPIDGQFRKRMNNFVHVSCPGPGSAVPSKADGRGFDDMAPSERPLSGAAIARALRQAQEERSSRLATGRLSVTELPRPEQLAPVGGEAPAASADAFCTDCGSARMGKFCGQCGHKFA